MKKLKLSQPYASMVISGTLEAVPNIWGDVKYGEKIFIYADNVDKDFENGLDYNKALHRKVFNEMFLGNIPDSLFNTEVFLGYVIVGYTGEVIQYWSDELKKFLFVTDPHKFETPVDDYSTDLHDLYDAKSRLVKTRRITKRNRRMIVPVGDDAWNQLRDEKEYKHSFLFWEDYMKSLVQYPWMDADEEDIYLIKFEHQKKSITFSTNEPRWCMPIEIYGDLNKDHITVLYFDLDELSTVSQVGFDNDKKQESYKGHKNNWVQMISTPIGGMTKWKRK